MTSNPEQTRRAGAENSRRPRWLVTSRDVSTGEEYGANLYRGRSRQRYALCCALWRCSFSRVSQNAQRALKRIESSEIPSATLASKMNLDRIRAKLNAQSSPLIQLLFGCRADPA